MKNVGRSPLELGEARVKVGDNDLGQMTWKSGEKTSTRDEILLARIEVVSQRKKYIRVICMKLSNRNAQSCLVS